MATINLADLRQIADVFSPSVTYAVGDHCVQGGLLYECTTAHTGAWNASHFNQVKIGEELSSLKADFTHLENDKADMIISSASGAIASFADGANYPIKQTVFEMNPVQDLHGREYPYPAGGGKNLLQLSGRRIVVTGTASNTAPRDFSEPSAYIGITMNNYFDNSKITSYSITDTSVSVITTASGYGVGLTVKVTPETEYAFSFKNATLSVIGFGFYNNSGEYLSNKMVDSATKWKFTTPANCTNMTVVFRPAPASSYLFDEPQLELGSTITSFAPYSNICPILGHTEVDAVRTGHNVWDEQWELGQFNNATGQPISANDCIRSKNFIPVLPSSTYYTTYGNGYMQVFFYGVDESFISQTWIGTNNLITTPSGCYKMKFRNASAYGTTYNNDISINYPSTDHSYHAYNGQSVTYQLGQTVYAGTLTINEDGTGQIVSKCASVDLGSFNWSLGGTTASPVFYTTIIGKKAGYDSKNVCSAYSYYGAYYTGMSNNQFTSNSAYSYLYVKDLRFDNAADFKANVAGVQLVYELATPVTINLTEQEVIETLYGNNNVWHDANGDTAVQYRADTKLYIDNKFAELQTLIANL